MAMYEFYWRDDTKGYELVKLVPERRKNRVRVTRESLISLAKKIFGDRFEPNKVKMVQKGTVKPGKYTQPNPYQGTKREDKEQVLKSLDY